MLHQRQNPDLETKTTSTRRINNDSQFPQGELNPVAEEFDDEAWHLEQFVRELLEEYTLIDEHKENY